MTKFGILKAHPMRAKNGKGEGTMRCEEVHKRIPSYVMGELTETEVIAMDEHIDRCEDCMRAVDDYLGELGFHDFDPEKDELFHLMRIPVPSQEQVREGVDEVLSAINRLRTSAMAHQPLFREPIPSSRPRQMNVLGKNFVTFGVYGLAAAAAIFLVAFVLNKEARYKALEQQFVVLSETIENLKRQNEILRQENEALQRMVEDVSRDYRRSWQIWERKFTQLQQESEKLKERILQPKVPSEVLVTFQDRSGAVVIKTGGEVLVGGKGRLPSSVANLVREFVVKGTVKPVKSTLIAMSTLKGNEMGSALRSAHSEESVKPIPLSPVLTAVRSTHPTLKWAEVPDAEEYVVRVADKNDKVVWEGSAGTQTQITLPSGLLKRGQVYFWQVEAIVGGQSLLSPSVGFWVLDERELQRIVVMERKFKGSALILASIYAHYGLYEEALVQVERLLEMNPANPFVQEMERKLRHQLGRE